MKKSFNQILVSISEDRDRKISAKLPSWAGRDGLEYPSSLCLEQCSSEPAAAYKAGLIRMAEGQDISLADLTGGLGVDSLAFSKVCSHVIYNEIDPKLAAAAGRNFTILGAGNIRVSNSDAEDLLQNEWHTDWIFLDPARRDAAGKKVFLLENCSPNVLALMPSLWEHADRIMLKLSPMADITMLGERLGNNLKEIHVVGIDGECKELLCILTREKYGDFRTVAVEIKDGETNTVTFQTKENIGPSGIPVAGDILFEPSATLMKSGFADTYCLSKGYGKFDRFTQLYSRPGASDFESFGKTFRVIETIGLSGSGIKAAGKKYPEADVTAKNIRISSEELKKRLGTRSGNGIHIFGASISGEKMLIVCKRIL